MVHFWDLRQPHALRHLSGIHICGEGIDINQKGTEVNCVIFKLVYVVSHSFPACNMRLSKREKHAALGLSDG